MLISEEEKKKKEDEAKKIIKSFHENKSFDADNDTLNTNELNFNNKLKEARDIINSINPRQEIPTYTNNINQEVMQSDYDISSNSTLQENEKKKRFELINKNNEFSDGYQWGDLTKTALGTAMDIKQDLASGVASVGENIVDVGANLFASAQDILGFDNAAKKTREWANKNYSEKIGNAVANLSPIGALYNLINGTFGNNVTDNSFEKSSILGETSDKVVNLVGYTGGLFAGGAALKAAKIPAEISVSLAGGHVLNIPTLAVAGGMAGSLQEANLKGDSVTEAERWSKALLGGGIEGVTEGIMGALGIGGFDITDDIIQKATSKVTSSAGKMLTQIGIQATGEAVEEFLSYAGNYVADNLIVDHLGKTDFSTKWDWADVGEQMALAFASTVLSSGGNVAVNTNNAIKSAEKQEGRKLTPKEKADLTQTLIDQAMEERKIIELDPEEKGKNVQKVIVANFDNDGNIANTTETYGRIIENPNGKVNVKPAIIKSNTVEESTSLSNKVRKAFNIIDTETGIVLDNNNYTTVQEAEEGFKNLITNLDEPTIKGINEKIQKTKLTIYKTMNEIQQDNKNVNSANSNINATQTNLQNEVNTFNVENVKNISSKFKSRQGYTKQEIAEIWDDIVNNGYDVTYDQDDNIQSYLDIADDGDNIKVTQYDGNDNVISTSTISKTDGRFNGKAIKNSIKEIISPKNENNANNEVQKNNNTVNNNSSDTIMQNNNTTAINNNAEKDNITQESIDVFRQIHTGIANLINSIPDNRTYSQKDTLNTLQYIKENLGDSEIYNKLDLSKSKYKGSEIKAILKEIQNNIQQEQRVSDEGKTSNVQEKQTNGDNLSTIAESTETNKNNRVADVGKSKQDLSEEIQKDIQNFSEQVDEVIEGIFPKNDMLTLLSKTPQPLIDIGLTDLPITMTQKHLRTIMNTSGNDKNANYHGLGIDIVKQLPEAINTPLDIVQSNTRNDSVVLTTYLADNQDRTIVASIKIDGKGSINDVRIDTNVMTSAYGRNNYEKFMEDNLKNGNLLYDIDRGVIKKVAGARLQLPRRNNSATNNNGSVINNSIAQNVENVKNKTVINNNSTQKSEKNTNKIDDFGEKIGGARKDLATQKNTKKKIHEVIHDYTVSNTENGYAVNFKGKILKDGFKTQDEAEKYILDYKENLKSNLAYVSQSQLSGKYFIVVRSTRSNKDTITNKTFDNKQDAENYAMALSMYLKEHGKNLFRPSIQKVERINPKTKNATKITGDDILNNFGFKGGEFGNWVTNNERQEFLNYAQDALNDLAEALDITSIDLGQNGQLSIAFGARGKGLSGAVAHFEPLKKVINMTRLKGAGSLAHEYGHSIDNWLSRISKYDENGMITEGRKGELSDNLYNAIKEVTKALKYNVSTNQEEIEKKNAIYETNRKKNLESALSYYDKLFNGEAKTYKRIKGKYEQVDIPVTKEQKAEYQKIRNTLMKGQITEERKFNSVTLDKIEIIYPEPINNLQKLIKEVTNRKIDDDTAYRLFNLGRPVKQVSEVLSESAYSKSAIELDKAMGRKEAYYSRIDEMWARAFESYINDKLKAKGITNTYLVHSVNNSDYALFNPFPAGEERANINKAFDNLIQVMKNEGIIHNRKINTNISLDKYIQEMAWNFQEDLANTLPGERFKAGDTWTGQKRSTTKELAGIKDETGASWTKIGEVLQDIADGKENNTKLGRLLREKIEDALMNGYTNIYKKNVMPNEEYLKAKGEIDGVNYLEKLQNDEDLSYLKDEDFRIFGMRKKSISNKKATVIFEKDGKFNRVKINEDIFDNNTIGKTISSIIHDYLVKHIGDYYSIIESGQKVYIGKDLPNEYVYSKSSQNLTTPQKMAKGRAVSGLKEIIENATNKRHEMSSKSKHKIDAKYGFYKYDTSFSFEYNGKEQIYKGTILIRNDADGKKYLYDILGIKKIGSNLPPVASNSKKSSARFGGSNSLPTNSITQNNKNVKSGSTNNYSMQKNQNNTNTTSNNNIRSARKTSKRSAKKYNEERNAEREASYIEQEIRKIEETGDWDDSIPVTKMSTIRKTLEDYLGIGIQKGHFKEKAYAIYKQNRDIIRTEELKDMDSILHETGHALDLGKRIDVDKNSIADELLRAVKKYGGYETDIRSIQLDEGFAEVIREYSIIPEQAKKDYPQTVAVIEEIRTNDKSFDKFMTKIQTLTYNYIHQSPRNRGGLSNQSVGEQTDKIPLSKERIKQELMTKIYDKDYVLKEMTEKLSNGRKLTPSENAYLLTRLSSGRGDKAVAILSNGYIDSNGNVLIPGLNKLGEILNNDVKRFDDLRSYLVAQRDLEYKKKKLITGIRTNDSKHIVEQFKNDVQIQEASKVIYDTLDGVLQYAVENRLITQENANELRKSNAFYVPMQRVIENRGNQVGRRGAVNDVIKARTGSELDIKDVLENVITNSMNILQQVDNNNALKAIYKEGEASGITGAIYDVIPTPMTKIGTANLSIWENELKSQGVNTAQLDLEKTIDLFAPNTRIDTKNRITSFINEDGKRVYLQFNDELIFNSVMNLDSQSMSNILKINSYLNMPLKFGATMGNIGFSIPNMISDTAQATIYSTAGFIPIIDNAIGVLDVLTATNSTVQKFMNSVAPNYVGKVNNMYQLYMQSGSSSSTRLSQYRKSTQEIMKNIYGTKNSEVLGIHEKFKPLKRLLDFMSFIPEISEQSTRLRVYERNYDYYKNKGMSETDSRLQAAIESRDATQDFNRSGTITREINQLIPFSAARVGSVYTFAEKIKANPKKVSFKIALLAGIAMAIKALGYDDDRIEELNQRKKDDNFVFGIGDNVYTIKKPQGVLRSIVNLTEYIQDLVTGHIEEGKEGERLVTWVQNSIMDNMPADQVTGLIPNAVTPLIENAVNKDFYYNTDIVKSYDLDLPDYMQYYDYNSQLAIWLGRAFNYSPAKIDNLISGYFGGLGTQLTGIIDTVSSTLGLSAEKPKMGAESNSVGKRFVVNVNSNSSSLDTLYDRKTELTKLKNGGTITETESQELELITSATSNIAKINKQIKSIKSDLKMSGEEKAEKIRELQKERTDMARKALGKDLIYPENESKIEITEFYPTSETLSKNNYKLTLTDEMRTEYSQLANTYYKKYERQGVYNEEKLKEIKSKAKDYAKNELLKKYRSDLIKSK